ncbi:class II aldolase/adducin family protein [Streptomyces sp. AJS327]|uniref:class II aldolase/adducin family protein n=1 Tax=Streptomyces sp. AJS327 TaxID=2545265 RepID=UPI0015DEC247|nr:class II aldolase/adducin family protein [Streptomyces sp. AJS327]MBA0054272.1 class II aldolase/adducin family protein [Streptomyces sp. AJS327]
MSQPSESAPPTPPAPVPAGQLRFALPPRHGSVAEEREHRKRRLAAALRLLGRYGHEEGVAGHITARDPEFTDCLWVNPFGMPFGHLTVSDLLLVNRDGEVVEGRAHVNQAAFLVHSQVHQARPEVVAVAHSHSVHGRAFATLGVRLDPLTQESCAFYEDHAVLRAYTGVAVDEAEGRRVAATLGSHKALILRNHGLLTVGDSVDAATWWFLQLDRACQIQLAARAAGNPVLIDHRNAVATREHLGSDLVAWMNYQPLYASVTRAEPDLLS